MQMHHKSRLDHQQLNPNKWIKAGTLSKDETKEVTILNKHKGEVEQSFGN